MMKKGLILLLALTLISCSESRPRLYPNERYQRTDSYSQQRAIDECMSLADQYVGKKNMALEATKQGAVGAGLGAATGAVGGAVFGKTGRGTGAGAAIGGMLGVASGLNDSSGHSQDYKNFVERCLAKKGYETAGWD
ncbi:MAG: hypothetical protein ACOX3T_01490 [Bdellovibrionota bacterium]